MKEYIYDKDLISDENMWNLFFKTKLQGVDTNSSLHITSGMFDGKREKFDYITFDDEKYSDGTFDHLLIVREKNIIKGMTRLDLPLIQYNCGRFVVMSYNQAKQLFSRETYTIIKKGPSFYVYDYDKMELLPDCLRHTQKEKRNFDIEKDLEKYTYFKKNVLPDFVTSDSEREL